MSSSASSSVTVAQLRQSYVRIICWTAFICLQIGVWAWEYCNTFKLDWAIIKGRVKRRPSGACFILSRLMLTACYVTHIFVAQSAMRINCQALWACLVLVSAVSVNCSNAIFCLRACAIWGYKPWTTIPLFTLWLIQVSFWLLDVMAVHLQGAFLPIMDNTCVPSSFSKIGAVPLVLTLLVDSTCATLIMRKLRGRAQLHDAPSMAQLMLREIQIFLILCLPITLAAAILYWISDLMLVKTALLSLVLFVHVLVSSRAFMALHYAGSHITWGSNTLLRNGERLKLEILDDLIFRSGCWCYVTSLQDDLEAPTSQCQRQHSWRRVVPGNVGHRHCSCRESCERDGSTRRRTRSSGHAERAERGCGHTDPDSCCHSRSSRMQHGHRSARSACRSCKASRAKPRCADRHIGACSRHREREPFSSDEEVISEAEYIEMLASRSGPPNSGTCAHGARSGDPAKTKVHECACRTSASMDSPRQSTQQYPGRAAEAGFVDLPPACSSSRRETEAGTWPVRRQQSYPSSLSVESEVTPASTPSSSELPRRHARGQGAPVAAIANLRGGYAAGHRREAMVQAEGRRRVQLPSQAVELQPPRRPDQGVDPHWPPIAAAPDTARKCHGSHQQHRELVIHPHRHIHDLSKGHSREYDHVRSHSRGRNQPRNYHLQGNICGPGRSRKHVHEQQYLDSPSNGFASPGGAENALEPLPHASSTSQPTRAADAPSTAPLSPTLPHLPRYRSVQDLSLSSDGESSSRVPAKAKLP